MQAAITKCCNIMKCIITMIQFTITIIRCIITVTQHIIIQVGIIRLHIITYTIQLLKFITA